MRKHTGWEFLEWTPRNGRPDSGADGLVRITTPGGGWLGDLTDHGDSYQLGQQSIDGNWKEACAILPSVAQQRFERAWCGLEAMSTDNLPLVGTLAQLHGFVLATGFSGHGFAIAPAVGRAVADLIQGKVVGELDGIRPDRFPKQS